MKPRHSGFSRDAIAKVVISATVITVLVASAALYSGTLGMSAQPQLEHMVAFALVICAAPNLVLLYVGHPGRRYTPTLKVKPTYDIIVDANAADSNGLARLVSNLRDHAHPQRIIYVCKGSTGALLRVLQERHCWGDGPDLMIVCSFARAKQLCRADVTVVIRDINARFSSGTVSRGLQPFSDHRVLCVEGNQTNPHPEASFWARLAELYDRLGRVKGAALPALVGVALPMETVTFYRTWMLQQLTDDDTMPWPQDHPEMHRALLQSSGKSLVRQRLFVYTEGDVPSFRSLMLSAAMLRKQQMERHPLKLLWEFDVSNVPASWLSARVVQDGITQIGAPVCAVVSLMVTHTVPFHIVAMGGMLFYLNRLWVLSTKMVSESDTVFRWLFAFICLPIFELCVFLYVPDRDKAPQYYDEQKVGDTRRRTV